jgi:hypothetical protein
MAREDFLYQFPTIPFHERQGCCRRQIPWAMQRPQNTWSHLQYRRLWCCPREELPRYDCLVPRRVLRWTPMSSRHPWAKSKHAGSCLRQATGSYIHCRHCRDMRPRWSRLAKEELAGGWSGRSLVEHDAVETMSSSCCQDKGGRCWRISFCSLRRRSFNVSIIVVVGFCENDGLKFESLPWLCDANSRTSLHTISKNCQNLKTGLRFGFPGIVFSGKKNCAAWFASCLGQRRKTTHLEPDHFLVAAMFENLSNACLLRCDKTRINLHMM